MMLVVSHAVLLLMTDMSWFVSDKVKVDLLSLVFDLDVFIVVQLDQLHAAQSIELA